MIDKLTKFARVFASDVDFKFLISKAMEFMMALDEECQEDRMACTVKPMCDKRRWLSILIKAGVPKNQVPPFCYELQQKIMTRSLNKEKYFYEPEDCAIYLDDFFLLMPHESPSKLIRMLENEAYDSLSWKIETFFRKKFKKVIDLDMGESLILLADDIMWYFDYLDRYVILNLHGERFLNQSSLLATLKLLNRYNKLKVRIFEKSEENWLLDLVLFRISSAEIGQDDAFKKLLADEIGKIAKLTKDINFKIEENQAHLLITINAFCGITESIYSAEPVTYGEIQTIYNKLVKIKNNINNWVKENYADTHIAPNQVIKDS